MEIDDDDSSSDPDWDVTEWREQVVRTHRNFRSLEPTIPNVEKLNKLIGEAIFKNTFTHWDVKTLRGETRLTKDKIEKFKLDLETIDRVYYFRPHFLNIPERCVIGGGMILDGEIIFFDCQIEHERGSQEATVWSFITTDPNIFFKSVLRHDTTEEFTNLIRQSLAVDEFHLDEDIQVFIEYYKRLPTTWDGNTAWIDKLEPNLKRFAASLPEFIQERLDANNLKYYFESLPNVITNRMDDFIEFIHLRVDHEYNF